MPVGFPFGLFGGAGSQTSSLVINQNHFFIDETERDSHFINYPDELIIRCLISVGTNFQMWDGNSWIDKTAVVKGKESTVKVPRPIGI